MSGVQRHMPPMPRHIQSLPRDRRGYPIPYVAAWSGDRPASDPPASMRQLIIGKNVKWRGHVVNELDAYGVGEPALGNVEAGRQLECHEHGLCGVCRRVIGRRRTFIGGSSGDPELQAYTEAPLHRACAVWSLRVCPSLLAGQHGTDILVVTDIDEDDIKYRGVFMDEFMERTVLPFDFVFDWDSRVLMGVYAMAGDGRQRSATEYLARFEH